MIPNFRRFVRDYIRGGLHTPESYEEYEWMKACASKVWFRTDRMASNAAKRNKLQAYKCKYCRYWHLARRLRKETVYE